MQYLWRQRADTNTLFKKINKYQSITKYFLQDHIDKHIIDKKVINKIIRDKNFYKVNTKPIDEKDQSFPVSPNDFAPVSILTPINKKHPRLISLC